MISISSSVGNEVLIYKLLSFTSTKALGKFISDIGNKNVKSVTGQMSGMPVTKLPTISSALRRIYFPVFFVISTSIGLIIGETV